ncbi:MAG: hypothetical protein CO135_03110 [Candidatus Levybacteria bacterium CG_4_9_14_3_um_filter_35_16]|nr:MAG: hypothetical protein COW87_01465 [Candidatus Levybacteria bacterium CG22_combo_CG10-13_8_21_14_all_35_11]PIY94613.1 MAG: hypothetical protein COY68_01910 [Candidatus Levybacteria bacterium CG_4_10_14_0_8_um_filter_35_23]PIZ97809.1 MAG: hypothetical protein COX78_04265 [Candidatus Levybacteria bacterium CG_4_10_14_0_2_um_filter_35_8]PJA91062.1 MAG: hypothetical protein CO135_03110 [Candidatus Levybacteria bacterium CG_4_9_14_3_um_filter_35_16]PJC54268.1 MAG: hypothetical protein CO028_03
MLERKRKIFGSKLVSATETKIETLLGSKRQRLVISVILLSIGLFVSEYFLGKSGIYLVFILSLLSDFFLFLALRKDLKNNFMPQIFILPFLFSLSFGMFYLLVPARLLTRIFITGLYATGLYSLFLSENIFTVSSMRTIALLSGARTVTFTLTLLSFFFLSNVVFSMHLNVLITLAIIFIYTFPIVLQSLWIHTLEKNILSEISWALLLTICLFELSVMLWFWPSTPTLISLFLTGVFYSLIGLTQMWFDKRLFRSVIWEYILVSIIVFIALVLYTSWI